MRLGKLLVAVLLLAALGQRARLSAQEGSSTASAPAPTPIETATRQNAFTIPFRIEPPQAGTPQPVEVQLHVSTDQGATWALASRVRPERGSFVFRAPHDGEYWYSIRTVDAQGIARPEAPLSPQLKVTVDTVAPRLDLSAARGPAGEIVARWQAVDPNVKKETFKLEYQATSTGPWERVAVESPPSALRHTLAGEATWWPNAPTGPILVRAEISDTAGNPAVTQAIVKPSDAAPPSGPAANAPTSAARSADTAPPADTDGWRRGTTDQGVRAATRWPPDRAMDRALSSTANNNANVGTAVTGVRSSDGTATSSAPAGFVPDEKSRTSAQTVSNNSLGRPGSPLDFSVLPAAVRPRMIGSRQFELEYEIESVGPSGVGRVELWGTRDGGRTWSDYAIDPDNRSPMNVSVGGEGIYGFRILVQSGSGFGGRPPAEGDMPDIWVGVDTTPPTCRITGAELSADGTELEIRWEAFDDVLDPRPVALLFSPAPGGAWTPIASGLENTGSYRWRLDARVPERIVLRLEVRDEAGNVGTFETPEPLALDRHRPAGRIRGVRPLGNP